MRSGRAWLVFGLIVLGVVLLGLTVLVPLTGFGGAFTGRRGMMDGFCPWCGGSGSMGRLVLFEGLALCGGGLVLVGLLVAAVVLFTREGRFRPAGDGTAFDILRERYARGEISKEEYDEIRRELGS